MAGANLRCVYVELRSSFTTVYLTGRMFFTDTTLPEDFFTTVATDGVDFVFVFDDDDKDADERMTTTVVEFIGLLLLLLVTVVAKRPLFANAA